MPPSALPYHEPGIIIILTQSSFIILLNAINYILDRIVYCGLLGQIFIGIAFGTPGARWIGEEFEHVTVQLGYLGLILLVYEGGLSTSFPSLKANFLLSSAVAMTGIAIPIGLSFTLRGLLSATSLQAFAAGAALCSTSLGTTFTILGTSGLTNTRLGTVLTSAAMMDDVVGLVMVQVIANLGRGTGFDVTTVIRPVFVSIGFGIAIPALCRFCIVPLTAWLNVRREKRPTGWIQTLFIRHETAFTVHTLLLVAMVTGATYAGTSNLFAAYLTGAMVSWWDSEVSHPLETHPTGDATPAEGVEDQHEARADITSGMAIYHGYYSKPVNTILKPLFFASIGFSIPITRMFTGGIVWRGFIYTALMMLGKFVCGLWLVRFSVSVPQSFHPMKLQNALSPSTMHFWGKEKHSRTETSISNQPVEVRRRRQSQSQRHTTTKNGTSASLPPTTPVATGSGDMSSPVGDITAGTSPVTTTDETLSPTPTKPFSLYPASILGLAMVARGEIGFLISSVAESRGVFGEDNQDIFLAVTWAVVLCTIVGPVGVGLLVRRLRRLEKEKEAGGSGRDVLGVWGVSIG